MTTPVCLTSASDLRVQINANGSLRRIDHRDVIVNLFPGNEAEGGPTNLYLRRRDRSVEAIPLLGPGSGARDRLRDDGFAARGTWSDVRFDVSLLLAQAAPAWFWHVALENVGGAAAGGRPDPRAGPRARRLRRGAAERVLRQPVPRPHAARARRSAAPCWRCARTIRWAAAIRGRCSDRCDRATSFATDALQLHGLATRAARRRRRCTPRRCRGAAAARARDGGDAGRAGATRAGRARRARLLRLARARPSGGDLGGRPRLRRSRARAARGRSPRPRRRTNRISSQRSPTLFSDGPLLACRDLGESEIDRSLRQRAAPRRARGRTAPLLLRRRASTRRAARARSAPCCARTGRSCAPATASCPTRRRSRRRRGWPASSTRWSRRATSASTASSRRRTRYLGLFRSHGQRVFVERDGRLAAARRAVGVRDGRRAAVAGSTGTRADGSRCAAGRRSTATSCWLDDRRRGRRAVPLPGVEPRGARRRRRRARRFRFARRATTGASRSALPPDTDVGRRFPDGCFRIDPARGTAIERVGRRRAALRRRSHARISRSSCS